MRTLSLFSVSVLVAAGCSIERKPPADTSRAGVAGAAPPQTPAAPPPTTNANANDWTLSAEGIGPIRVGMSATDVQRVAGDFAAPSTSAECTYVRPSKMPAGVSIMFARGQVARIDVDSAGIRSDAGIAIGDSASKVSTAYAGRVTTMPHKYIVGGQYLSVRPSSPSDSMLRIVFESDSGRISGFRGGRTPEVAWVERCG